MGRIAKERGFRDKVVLIRSTVRRLFNVRWRLMEVLTTRTVMAWLPLLSLFSLFFITEQTKISFSFCYWIAICKRINAVTKISS